MSANVSSVNMKSNASLVQFNRALWEGGTIPALCFSWFVWSSSEGQRPHPHSLTLLSGPLDHGFWRAVEEDEFGVQVFLQVQFPRFSDQEDVGAELEDPVHVGQLFEHDGVRDPAEELAHELPDNQNH